MRNLFVIVSLCVSCVVSAQTIITPAAPGPWQFTASGGAAAAPPAAYLAPGFRIPPAGSGSLHLITGSDGSAIAQGRNTAFSGTLLSSITALSYSAFVEVPGAATQAPYLNLLIDQDNNGTVDDQLFFEPAYQTGAFAGDPVPNQGTVTRGQWQTWNARIGGWWSLNAGTFGPPLITLDTYVATFPGARIVNSGAGDGGLRVMAGGGAGAWDKFLGAVDQFVIATTTASASYNFEPPSATSLTVTPATLGPWVLQNLDDGDGTNTATTTFVAGPGAPPLGDGSLRLSTGADTDSPQGRLGAHNDQFLRDLTTFTYWTYVEQDSTGFQAPLIVFSLDYDANGTVNDIIVFEPRFQTAAHFPSNPQQAVATGIWQQWDARNGAWYSIVGNAAVAEGVLAPLSTFIENAPAATLRSGNGNAIRLGAGLVNYGHSWPNFIGYADAATVGFGSTRATYDFEPVPTIDIADVARSEGNSGTTNFVFNVTLSAPVSQTVTAQYTLSDGTASVAGSDYASTPGTVSFTPGTTTATITVPVTGDTKFEGNETFQVVLANPQFATIADGQATGTITNDDAQPTLTILDDSKVEGNAGTTAFTFAIALSHQSEFPVTAQWATAAGTATAPADFTAGAGNIVIAPGQLATSVTVSVNGETKHEVNETFVVNLSNVANAIAGDTQAVGTIVNDDAAPAISIADLSQNEGDTGTTQFAFSLTLSSASEVPATVNYTTANGTAIAGSDYTASSGTVTFDPGQISRSINVAVTGDTANETGETFALTLSSPTNATLANSSATGTILNDDGVPMLSIGNSSQPEGNSGTASLNFTVTLSAPSGQTVTVNYATANGTATAGSDYTASNGTLVFTPGTVSQSISVPVFGDAVYETDQTFTVTLTAPSNAAISAATGTGTIQNDDAPPSITLVAAAQSEGNSGSTAFAFNVTLSSASELPASVNYTTADGTALAGSDYTATSGTVTFAPGVVVQTIVVPVAGDILFEPDETFTVALSAPSNAAISTAMATGTIQNDDANIGDLSLTMSAPAQMLTGQNSTFAITVFSAGPNAANSVVVTDVLPAGATFISATPSQGSCSGTTTITCNLGTLSSGSSATIALTVQFTTAGAVTNSATVTSTQTDLNPANNVAVVSSNVILATAIPTLSETMLMLTGLLLAGLGAWAVGRMS